MTMEMVVRWVKDSAAGQQTGRRLEAKPKNDEVLIEEILRAAGLEALD